MPCSRRGPKEVRAVRAAWLTADHVTMVKFVMMMIVKHTHLRPKRKKKLPICT